MINRQIIEERERANLAPFAALSADSRGRKHPQAEHELRTAFQRDRDRIVHSNAFRRMEYKTQVFLPHEGDHFRTRLTHTIEVAQISRTMARALCLNEDLTEAIALVHDLGHTPFGHSGEDVLNELLAESGGFNHNRQSLRVVDYLEDRYPDFPGLNLSWEVREGIVKHETSQEIVHPDFDSDERPTLEASLVDQADEITYNAHDIDDGLRSGLLGLKQVASLSIWETSLQELLIRNSECNKEELHKLRSTLVRWLLDHTARDVLVETERRLKEHSIDSLGQLRASTAKLCGYSKLLNEQVLEMKKLLKTDLYSHPVLRQHSKNAAEIIRTLFKYLSENPKELPDRFERRLGSENISIVVADYIAGMTDRYAEQICHRVK